MSKLVKRVMKMADDYAANLIIGNPTEMRYALHAAVEQIARDAARYRWLRKQAKRGTFGGVVTDAAIDAAMDELTSP